MSTSEDGSDAGSTASSNVSDGDGSDSDYTGKSSSVSESEDDTPAFAHEDEDEAWEDDEVVEEAAVPGPQPAPPGLIPPNPLSWNAPARDVGPGCPMPDFTRRRDHIRLPSKRGFVKPTRETDAFGAFFPSALVQRIATFTSKRLGTKTVTASDILDWIALLITMGIVKLPSTDMYWNHTIFGEQCI